MRLVPRTCSRAAPSSNRPRLSRGVRAAAWGPSPAAESATIAARQCPGAPFARAPPERKGICKNLCRACSAKFASRFFSALRCSSNVDSATFKIPNCRLGGKGKQEDRFAGCASFDVPRRGGREMAGRGGDDGSRFREAAAAGSKKEGISRTPLLTPEQTSSQPGSPLQPGIVPHAPQPPFSPRASRDSVLQ